MNEFLQFTLGGGKIALLGVNASEEAMRRRLLWIQLGSSVKFFLCSRQIVEVVPNRAQPVMRLAPFRFEAQDGLELFGCLSCVPLVFQRERQVVVGEYVVRFEVQSFMVSRNGLIPRLRVRELNRLLAVALGSLCERRRGK